MIVSLSLIGHAHGENKNVSQDFLHTDEDQAY